MIGWAILATAALLTGVALYAHRVNVRARRQRRSLRHVVGITPWWGKR